MDARRGSRSWGDHPIVVIIGILAGLAAITAFVLQLIGSDDDDPAPTGDVTTTVPQPDPSESATSDPSPSVEETTTTPPSGVDLELALQTNTCSVVPGGGLDGGDVMTLLFRTVSVGDVDYDGTVVAMAHSDSGLQGQSTGGMSSGSASSFVQVEFAGQDYGRTHEFTVEIEPAEAWRTSSCRTTRPRSPSCSRRCATRGRSTPAADPGGLLSTGTTNTWISIAGPATTPSITGTIEIVTKDVHLVPNLTRPRHTPTSRRRDR